MDIVLAGTGGYGRLYFDDLMQNPRQDAKLLAVVERFFETSPRKSEILEAKIPVYPTLEDFYRENRADLAILATPPFLHRDQTVSALEHGSNVLCEKPAAPTVREVEDMMAAQQRTGHFVAIGYQWSYSDPIQHLKRDILAGKLGKPRMLRTLVSWPRSNAYYARSGGWGGRMFRDGKLLLDSIASNACAHFIHNMLFVLGKTMDECIDPARVEAECLRAYPIENFDTCVLRMQTEEGAVLYFSASHAADSESGLTLEYEFENAVITLKEGRNCSLRARWTDGTVTDYGNPFDRELKKTDDCLDCIRRGTKPVCGLHTAIHHTRLIGRIYEHARIVTVPEELLYTRGDNRYVRGLWEAMEAAFPEGKLLSEVGFTPARPDSF